MKTRDEINKENATAELLKKNHFSYLLILVVFIVLSVLLNIFLIGAGTRFPQTKFLFTSDAQSVCTAISLKEPNVSAAKLKNFAATATLATHRFDFYNWKTQINEVLQKYFTPYGREAFKRAIQEAGVVRETVRNFYATSSAVSGSVVIKREGVSKKNNRYEWIVELPLSLAYRSSKETLRENRKILLSIVRVPVSPINPHGIAINRLISTQEIKK